MTVYYIKEKTLYYGTLSPTEFLRYSQQDQSGIELFWSEKQAIHRLFLFVDDEIERLKKQLRQTEETKASLEKRLQEL